MSGPEKTNPLKIFASEKITIASLFFLFILTIVGTLDQVNIGLFQAKQKYFFSIFCLYKYVPLPGGLLVMIVFSINLIASMVTKFKWNLRNSGLLLCHLGLIVLMLGSLVSYIQSKEGYLPLYENQSSAEFYSHYDYELLITDISNPEYEHVVGFSEKLLRKKKELSSQSLPFKIYIKEYFVNCEVDKTVETQFKELPPDKEPGNNRPGCFVQIIVDDTIVDEVPLTSYKYFPFKIENRSFNLLLQREGNKLPFTIKLLKARKEVYPGTMTPKHFESRIELDEGNNIKGREIVISMNKPLRHKGYTLYQSGFDQDKRGTRSVLAVVKNPAVAVPYISCLMVFLGMLVHFLQKLIIFLRRRDKIEKHMEDRKKNTKNDNAEQKITEQEPEATDQEKQEPENQETKEEGSKDE